MQTFGLFPGQSAAQLTRYTLPDPTATSATLLARTIAVAANSVQLPAAHNGLRTQRSVPGGIVCAALEPNSQLPAGQLILGPSQHVLCEKVLMAKSDYCMLPAGIKAETALSIFAAGVDAVRALLDYAQVHPGQRLAIIDDWPLRAELCGALAEYFGVEFQQFTTLTARSQLAKQNNYFHAVINFTSEVQIDQLALAALHPAGIIASRNAFAPDLSSKLALFVHMGARSKLNLEAAAMPLWALLTETQFKLPEIQLYPFTTPGVRTACSLSRVTSPVPILSMRAAASDSTVTIQN
jgi:hypothetical protein